MGHLLEGGAYFKVRVIIPMDFKTLTFSFQITTNNHHYMSSLKFIPELLVVFIFHSFYTCTICILTYGYIMVRFLISGAGFIRRHFLIRESMMQCLLEGASTSLLCLSVSLSSGAGLHFHFCYSFNRMYNWYLLLPSLSFSSFSQKLPWINHDAML